MLLGLFYLEFQCLRRSSRYHLGITQNPFIRYGVIKQAEYRMHSSLVRGCAYDHPPQRIEEPRACLLAPVASDLGIPSLSSSQAQDKVVAGKQSLGKRARLRSWWKQEESPADAAGAGYKDEDTDASSSDAECEQLLSCTITDS